MSKVLPDPKTNPPMLLTLAPSFQTYNPEGRWGAGGRGRAPRYGSKGTTGTTTLGQQGAVGLMRFAARCIKQRALAAIRPTCVDCWATQGG